MPKRTALDLALQWRGVRAQRLDMEKEVKALKVTEDELKASVVEALSKAANKSASNGDRLFQLVTKQEPTVQDWPTLYKHVQKTGAFELLYQRVNGASVKERWDIGEKVPGVVAIPVEVLSDTQAKRS